MDDQQLLAAELRRVLPPQPVAHLVGFVGAVYHHEEHGSLAERLELVAILLPALNTGCQIRLIPRAGDV